MRKLWYLSTFTINEIFSWFSFFICNSCWTMINSVTILIMGYSVVGIAFSYFISQFTVLYFFLFKIFHKIVTSIHEFKTIIIILCYWFLNILFLFFIFVHLFSFWNFHNISMSWNCLFSVSLRFPLWKPNVIN